MRRRAVTLGGFAAGALAGTLFYRRTTSRRRERVDVYFDDGSMLSLADGSLEAERLLPVARELVAAARR